MQRKKYDAAFKAKNGNTSFPKKAAGDEEGKARDLEIKGKKIKGEPLEAAGAQKIH